jgi:hypothetical protein
MGYRSEVAIKCQPNAFEKLMSVCEETLMKPDSIIEDGDCRILYWDWIKWYNTFDEIIAIEKCMQWLDENHDPDSDDGLGYHFIRLGEDGSDIDDETNDFDIELYYIRKIDLPEPLSEKEQKKARIQNLIADIKNGAGKTAEQIAEILDEIF